MIFKIIFVLLMIFIFFIFCLFAQATYITPFLILIFMGVIFYCFFKSWNLKKCLWLLLPVTLQCILFFNLIPSHQCKNAGADTWTVKCKCKGIEIRKPFFGASNCIGDIYGCKQRTPKGWEDYFEDEK
jgi:uncharacterized protein YqgC (DUF456 family)